MINVLIADDHQMFSESLQARLEREQDIRVLDTTTSGHGLLALLKTYHTIASVVLLDISMPELNGIETAKIIRKEYPNLKVLILTYHGSGEYIYNLYNMDVHGYVLKDKTSENLIESIRSIVKSGNRSFPPLPEWQKSGQLWKDEDIQLTRRELEVLELADLTSQEIAGKLSIGVNTVYTHLENMRKKFKVDTTAKLLRKAIRLGYIKP